MYEVLLSGAEQKNRKWNQTTLLICLGLCCFYCLAYFLITLDARKKGQEKGKKSLFPIAQGVPKRSTSL